MTLVDKFVKCLTRKEKTEVTYNPKDYKYFPHPGMIGYSKEKKVAVVLVDHRYCYDSSWCVTAYNFSTIIVRHDNETVEGLLDAILALPKIDKTSVESLDQRDKIYYD